MDKPSSAPEADWMDDTEGQLALDVYQTEDAIVLKAPIAGVSINDLEVAVTDEVVTIRGTREDPTALPRDAYFLQECFWGPFSRSYVLPVAVDADRTQAIQADGLLTITIPKSAKTKTRVIQVQALHN